MAKYPPVTARIQDRFTPGPGTVPQREADHGRSRWRQRRRPSRAPGEKRWTEAELKKVRQQLQSEIAGLLADINEAESAIAERLGDAAVDAGDDPADAGAKTYEREHELALTENARELLALSERALARMDDGTFGVCESCGQPIGKARLQAFPRATLCVTCKQREERR